MPITDDPLLLSKATTFPRSPMKSKKMRITCDELLNNSKKNFNQSKKRVENLKRNYNVKRFRTIEKPGEDDWITSGKIGSRDAVLVFRTRILHSNKTPSLKTSTSNTATNNDENCLHIENSYFDLNTSKKLKPALTNSVHSIKIVDIDSNTSIAAASESENFSETDSKESLSSNTKNLIPFGSASSKLNSNSFVRSYPGHKVEIKESVECLFDTKNIAYDDEEDMNLDGSDDNQNANIDEAAEFDIPYSTDMPAIGLKIKFKFLQTETKLLRKIFLRHGLQECKEDDDAFTILWTGVHMKPDILRNLLPYQRVNHFPRSYELTRKDRLYKNIENLQYMRGMKNFDFMPQSFLLPIEYRDLVTAHNKCRGPWIAKPIASSRGRGIFIVNTPDQIPQEEQVLVSKYITEPLCIDGHKCDVRVYVLVTSFDPLIIYLYEEGLVRLATVKYDPTADNLWNPCMHLCNYSINKYHSDYVKSSNGQNDDIGHKWTLSALLRHLKTQGCNTSELMANIEDLVIKSIFSCTQTITSACRMFMPYSNNAFELYGFDILIDDTLKPWLLEINLSPSMGVDSPIDTKVKACLITDLLTCIGIPAYKPAQRQHYINKGNRFRMGTTLKRGSSVDITSGANISSNVPTRRSLSSGTATILSPEEQRIVRNARLQNARRCRFVRIFPTSDSMQRYGPYLDPQTGIPISTTLTQGQIFKSFSFNAPHNYNQMLNTELFGKSNRESDVKECSWKYRLYQYERPLDSESSNLTFINKKMEVKCEEECKRLRKYIIKLIGNGAELTQLQSRKMFALYLETVLRRLVLETRESHENSLLKFLNRVGGSVKAPVFFRNTYKGQICNKARTAMVAKLLGEFLEQYNRETEAFVDVFDHFGMIPRETLNDFLAQAQEADLEQVLTINTNITGTMPYLYNRYSSSIPPTPPIPTGSYGFLKALPAMVTRGSAVRDFNKTEIYYNKDNTAVGTKNGNTNTKATNKKKKD